MEVYVNLIINSREISDWRHDALKDWLYVTYAVILAIVSFYTGEIVTFVMLGFILLSLNNINSTLKKLVEANHPKK